MNRLGIAPIAWTNDDLPELGGHIPFETCIDEMALAGYEGCELGGKFPRDPATLKAALDRRKLSISSGWISAFFTEPGREEETLSAYAKHLEFLKTMGARVVVVCECGHGVQTRPVSVFHDRPRFDDEQWNSLVGGLSRIGETTRKAGLRLAYHHHMGTGVQDGDEVDYLMERTDPELLSLVLDTGHLFYAGEDPLSVARKHVGRIRHVHLKDIRPNVLDEVRRSKSSFLESVKAGVFTVPGDGTIDFRPIFRLLKEARYEGWYIVEAEQDPDLANPLEYAKKAMDYVKKTASS